MNTFRRITKSYYRGKTFSNIKKEIIKNKGLKCEKCNKEKNYSSLIQLDHKIPVALGGEEIKNNLQLLCLICHKEKTRIDILIINYLKKLKILTNDWCTYLDKQKIAEIYNLLYDNTIYCKKMDEGYIN